MSPAQSTAANPFDALRLTLPQGTPPELITDISNRAREIFEQHGASAFAAPRKAALVHEASHAIVGTHEGLTIRRIEIHSKPDPTFGSVWGGRCVEAGWGWTSTNDTTAEEDLRRARFIVAGLTGEVLAKLDTPGSSIDEERLSRELGVNAALKLRDPALSQAEYVTFAINLWDQRVWRVAEAILRANWDILNQLAVHLDQHEQVKGNQLQKLLANVRKIAS